MRAERWITPLGMADRAAVKAVNRSDLWHPYGHRKRRELHSYWSAHPLIMINGNPEREKSKKLSGFVSRFDITPSTFTSFAVGKLNLFIPSGWKPLQMAHVQIYGSNSY